MVSGVLNVLWLLQRCDEADRCLCFFSRTQVQGRGALAGDRRMLDSRSVVHAPIRRAVPHEHALRSAALRTKVCRVFFMRLNFRNGSSPSSLSLLSSLPISTSGHTVQRMYTFARMVPIQAPTANTKRTASTRQRMTLSRKLGLSRESSTYEDANGGAKAKSIADIDAWEVAQQVTLRLHYLYASVPCDQMLFDLHSSPELTRFRAESERLQSMFVNHILICTEAKERADRIVHLLDVVDALLELRSFHAVMLIVMALQSTPVHRLKQTWALVGKLPYSSPGKLCDFVPLTSFILADAEHPGRWDDLHRSVGLGGQHLVSK